MKTKLEPLEAHRLFQVSNIEALEASLNPINGARLVNVGSGGHGFEALGNHCFLPIGELWFSRSNTNITIGYPDDDMLRLRLWHGGSSALCTGRHAAAVTHEVAHLSSRATEVQFDAGFEQICWRSPKERVAQKLASLTGSPSVRSIDVETSLDLAMPQTAALQQILHCLIQAADRIDPLASRTFLVELEQAFITSLLMTGTLEGRALLDAPASTAAPRQVRQAEAYIEANWNQPITIEDLAAAASTSVRSLFRTFKQNRGCSPLEFARRLRLQQAHRLLSHPQESTTVTEVAFSCGFGDLSRFAKEFQRNFGERPSELLARRRDFLAVA